MPEHVIMRRVAGGHNLRLDGIGDLLSRARGTSVLDVGCNRGQVGYDFMLNGAALVHGCDIYEPGIVLAREWFADLRSVQSQFEVVDLRDGPAALAPFGEQRYDITLMLATYHKLKRSMPAEVLSELMTHLIGRTDRYFGWRATSDKRDENWQEMKALDDLIHGLGFKRRQTSELSDLGLAAIWVRV